MTGPIPLILTFARSESFPWELLFNLAPFLFLIGLGLFIGRRVEQLHFASLKHREQLLADMLVTDLKSFPNAGPTLPQAKLFVGEVVIATDYLKNFLAGLRNIFGGNIRSYETLLERARREARLRIMEQAKVEGFNAICNLRFDTADIAGKTKGSRMPTVSVMASGTAYRAAT